MFLLLFFVVVPLGTQNADTNRRQYHHAAGYAALPGRAGSGVAHIAALGGLGGHNDDGTGILPRSDGTGEAIDGQRQ